MVVVRPFKGLRPPKEIVKKLASRPYDVMNSKEAREDANENKYSFLHITKAEIDFDEELNVKEDSDEVFEKALENFNEFKEKKWLIKDNEPKYLWTDNEWDRTQYGLVGCASIDDYFNGKN